MALAPHDLHDCSLSAWLAAQAHRTPHANAILAPDRTPMTYSHLWQCLQETRQTLRTLGVGRQDRVAVVLPDGPEMAVACLAIAASVTCAPLNPAYRDNEYEFYFADLGISALIVQSGVALPARTAAQAHGIPLIELTPIREAAAGRFTLQGNIPPAPTAQEDMYVDDVALILHTSGTTSRPKIVPLTQRNLMMSAHNIAQTLALDAHDRCLNIMPLFHIHGLSRCHPLIAGRWCKCGVYPRVSPPAVFHLAHRVPPDVVHRRAHDASRRAGTGDTADRGYCPLPPPFHSLVLCALTTTGHGRAGAHFWGSSDRGLWHDRGSTPDCQ